MTRVDPPILPRKAQFITAAIAVTMLWAQPPQLFSLAKEGRGQGRLGGDSPAGGPPNDECSGAIVIPVGTFPLLSPAVDVTDATFANDPITSCTSNDDHGVWFSFTPASSGQYTISTCASVAPSSTVPDTVLGIWTSPDCVNFTEVTCNDDSCGTGGHQSRVTTTLTSGTAYLIYASVFGFQDPVPPPPNDVIQVAIELGPPANDTCASAEIVPAAGPFPVLTSTVNVTNATTAGDPTPLPTTPCTTATALSRSVWYTFVPQSTAQYAFSTCADAPCATTVDDTVIAVYSSTGGCTGPFTLVACDDDSCVTENGQAATSASLTSATQYYIVGWKHSATAPSVGNTDVQLRITSSLVFADGFESNDTSRWSFTVP